MISIDVYRCLSILIEYRNYRCVTPWKRLSQLFGPRMALAYYWLILRAVFSRVYTVWIALAGFSTFVVHLYYIWVHYYIWSIVIIFVPSTKLEEKVYRNCLDLRWFITTDGYVHNMSSNDSGWTSNDCCWCHLQIQQPSRLISKRKGFLKHLRLQVRLW